MPLLTRISQLYVSCDSEYLDSLMKRGSPSGESLALTSFRFTTLAPIAKARRGYFFCSRRQLSGDSNGVLIVMTTFTARGWDLHDSLERILLSNEARWGCSALFDDIL